MAPRARPLPLRAGVDRGEARWSLSVNRTEKRVLVRRAEGCRNLVVKVRRATVRTSTKSGGGSTGGSGGTDPQFDYCYQAKDAGYGPYYKGQDEEYTWYEDADGDGVVCE